MSCFKPLKAYRTQGKTENGKQKLTFLSAESSMTTKEKFIELPCGQCLGCRLERSRQWAIRCVNEASLHEDNCFITLTYAPEHLPENNGLVKPDFQKFMKRLRKKYPEKKLENSIRYYMCGEYGDKRKRPHYHALLFNHDFTDRIAYDKNEKGEPIYTSPELTEIWGKGITQIGDLNFESAAYVARYTTKKVNGAAAAEHYERLNPDTGELHQVEPEYSTMSRRPGIASKFYEKWKGDIFPSDNVVIRGRVMKPPAFYLDQLERDDPQLYEKIKTIRKENYNPENSKTMRLLAMEKIKEAQNKMLKRSLERET